MAARIPTRLGISRLLAKAGFERSRPSSGFWGYTSGYVVRESRYLPGAVSVEAVLASHLRVRERTADMIDRYAETIERAGYATERDKRGHLIITAPGESS